MRWDLDLAYLMVLKIIMLFLGELVFCRYLPRKSHFVIRLIAGTLAGMALAFLIPLDWGSKVLSGTIVFLVHILISFGWLYLLFRIDLKGLLFIVSMGKITTSVAIILELPLGMLFPDLRVNYVSLFSAGSGYFLLRSFLAFAITCFVMYILFGRKYTNLYISDRWKTTLWMTMIMVFIIDVLIYLIFYTTNTEQETTDMQQLITNQLIELFMHVFIILLLNTVYIQSQTQTELDNVNALWSKARKQYALSKENVDAINRKCHDLKHRLMALKTSQNSDDFQDIYREIDIYDSRIKTGNEVLDVILAEKSLLCADKDIHTEFMIDGSKLDFMDSTDLFILFGNILDNCIEAVELLEPDKRFILCNVISAKGLVMIHTSNPYSGTIQMAHGRMETSKKNKENHGYGMLSIHKVVEKYGGEISIQMENQQFHLDILIPEVQNRAK